MAARRARLEEVAHLRGQFLATVRCQIVRWSLLPRGFAYVVVVEIDGEIVGYGAVRTSNGEDTLVEFFTLEGHDAITVGRSIFEFSRAPRA